MENYYVKINNLDKILNILSEKQSNGLLYFEHLGDLVYYLEKFDKKRNIDDLEFKNAILTLTKHIIDNKIAIATSEYAYNYCFPPPKEMMDFDDVLNFINKNWNIMDKVDRYYLIFFLPK